MENQDKMTFSLDDNPDDEVVEEEVIDRDEEYDVDDDDEDYDEEYDDEDYDDEDYDDEEYDDEEYDDEDGYNDDYYDDRLNKVLDEIAELKRGMQAPSTVVQPQQPQPPLMPQYIYQPTPPVPSAGSEVVMYNEISRLRDELAKNQSSLEMQKELTRIKEDMSRDQKFAESQYNAEIKRLQDRIDDLLKNASGPQSENGAQPASSEGEKSLDVDKLLAINEAVLRAMRDTDAHILGEISALKKQLEDRPSMDELTRAIASVKKAIQNIDVKGLNGDAAAKLSNDIAALKDALAGGAPAPVSVSAPVVVEGGSDIVASELLRQLYEIKNLLGSSSAAAVKRTQTLCELVSDFKKFNYDVHSQNVGYKDKLASAFGYSKKLSECTEPDALDLIQATNTLIEELASAVVTRTTFADIAAFCQETGNPAVTSAMRESADRFFNIAEKLEDVELDGVVDLISDLIAEKNVIQHNEQEEPNNKALLEITDELFAEDRDEEAIRARIADLAEFRVGEIIDLPLVPTPKTYKASRTVDDENIFSKLAELKAAILDSNAAENANSNEAEEEDEAGDEIGVVLEAIDELEAKLTAATGTEGLSQAIEEVRANYLDIVERLVEISEKVSAEPQEEAQEEAAATTGMTEEEIVKTLDDLDYIRNKLDEHEVFINQIADMRADILGMAGTVDNSEQSVFLSERFEAVVNEITSQCDKLYEDLSNILVDTENNIVTRISESTAVVDAIADAKAGILADTQAIQDSIAKFADSLGTSPLGDAVEQLRTDVLNLTDQTTINADAAMLDRQKLLDDIAFLREQAEIAIAERDAEAAEEVEEEIQDEEDKNDDIDKLFGYLDDISARIELLTSLPDSVSTILDTLVQSQDDVQYIRQKLDDTAVNDSIATVSENLTTVNDSLASIMNDIGVVLDKLEAYEQQAANNKQEIVDTVSGIREEIHINELDENISATGIDDETRDLLVNEIVGIRDRLNSLEESTQGISDASVAALDNISTRLDELQAAVTATAENEATGEDPDVVVQTLDDVNEKLNLVIDSLQGGTIDLIMADIADIKAKLEEGNVAEGEATATASDDSMQAVIDDLAEIKEKLYAEPEYDTVEEILSLRDDVKAARIVDQNEVSSELEAIKNELAALASGSILDEVRALREDVAAIGGGQAVEGDSAPTDGELNLVLNEIVSLRDEVFALKDEVLNAAAISQQSEDGQVEQAEGDNAVNNILDELGDLRDAQSELVDSIEELKDVISRRTTIAAEGDGDAEAVAQSNELNVVLDEIINLKADIDGINERIPAESIELLTKQIEELHEKIDGLAVPTTEAEAVAESEATTELGGLDDIREKLDNLALAVDGLRIEKENIEIDEAAESGVVSGSLAENLENLRIDIEDVKAAIATMAAPAVGDEIAELRAEIENLKAENEALKNAQNDALALELAELKEAVHGLTLSTPAQTEDGETSYAALIDEIKGLKDQIVEAQTAQTATLDEETLTAIRDALSAQTANSSLAGDLGEIRDEIAQLRSLTTVAADRSGSAEIAGLRDEIAELKNAIASHDSMFGLAEDVTTIRADVRTLKEEPDLGVMSEILALRDEFQALREQIEDVKRVAAQTDKQADEDILNEIQSLRDQLFAISMANVNDSASGESNYESYNNIILDEIASIRDHIDVSGSADDLKAVSDEIAQLKSALDEREELYNDLANKVTKLDKDATNNKILEELASLRTELANQREADLTTLNFMSEMAHLLERQNSYIAQNTGSKISDEIESLKAEIASSDAVAEEVAKLREIMTQSGSASDNDTILGELADLREELSSEKPSKENELILQEIARLRDEITLFAERENAEKATAATVQNADELADSLSDLKDQLNEIAGIIEPDQKPKTTRKKSTGTKTGAKKTATTKKPAAKSGTKSASTAKKSTATGAKRGRKPAQKRNVDAQATAKDRTVTVPLEELNEDDFAKKVDTELSALGGGAMSLDPNAQIPSTNDAMDVADKLAQQVANKLVIEQLVEQLGDDGMSEEQVDEILRELPIELNTTALDDQSDKVRKLANRLVLDKLRSRLGQKSKDDE